MVRESKVFIYLKCPPGDSEFLRGMFEKITAAYHMNKWHWISVYLNSDVLDEFIMQLVYDSYRLTEKKTVRKDIKDG